MARHFGHPPRKSSRPLFSTPASLRQAVLDVRTSNIEDYHGDGRWGQFAIKVRSGSFSPSQMIQWIEKRVQNPQVIHHIADDCTHCGILTIEDYLIRFGTLWGFSTRVINQAQKNVLQYDRAAGLPQRWV